MEPVVETTVAGGGVPEHAPVAADGPADVLRRAARIVPLPDDSGLGLVRLGIVSPAAHFSARWHVADPAGPAGEPGTVLAMDANGTVTGPDPFGTGATGAGDEFRALPLPPLTALPDTWSVRVRATLTSVVASDGDPIVEVEAPVLLATLAVPPVLVLCTGRGFQTPALALCPSLAFGGTLDGLLAHLAGVTGRLDRIGRTLAGRGLDVPARYEGMLESLAVLMRVLAGPSVRLLSSPQEPDLNAFELLNGLIEDVESEDEVLSLVYFGLPGPGVQIWPQPNFDRDAPIDDRYLELGVTEDMAARGEFLVPLEDLRRATPGTPGVPHSADLGGALYWTRSSSYRFTGMARATRVGDGPGGAAHRFRSAKESVMSDLLARWERRIVRLESSRPDRDKEGRS